LPGEGGESTYQLASGARHGLDETLIDKDRATCDDDDQRNDDSHAAATASPRPDPSCRTA